jgi:hypothetical protein
MSSAELMPTATPEFDFGDFDLDAAFQEAVHGVASDAELALEEKIRRMETIITEGTSDLYRDFVDLRQMAAQLELFCAHDHALGESMQTNETISTFMNTHRDDDHDHGDQAHPLDGHAGYRHHTSTSSSEAKKKAKKKKKSWLELLLGK